MESIRKFLTGRTAGDNGGNSYDDNIMNGPSIRMSPGQIKEEVHYMESRGSIDLSYLRFYSDDYSISGHNFDFQTGSNRTNIGDNGSGGSTEWKESFLDIAVFEVPEHCTSKNCDLSKFGIGSLTHFDGSSYLSLCQAGRLQLDHNIFEGHHTQLMIPSEGAMPDRIKRSKNSKFSMPKNRHYEVMLANCNQKGRQIHVVGQVVFDVVDSDAVVNNLTAESLTILVSLAFMVFALLTILAIRVNLGTRADFEHAQYLIVSGNDEDGEETRSGGDDETMNEDEEVQIDDNETNQDPNEDGFLSRGIQTTVL